MANRERGEVDLAFGDERYTLRFSFNAIAEIETYLDLGINDISALMKNPSDFRVGRWRVMLWGALREHHGGLGMEEAGEIMMRGGLALIIEKLGEAMQLAFPAAGGKENPRRASRKVGKPS